MTPQQIIAKAIKDRDISKITVIYHGNCSDGFGAAWAIHNAIGDNADYLPAVHGMFDPFLYRGDYCFIADFSFDLDTLLAMERRFKHVVVLDHHKSAEETLAKFGSAIFDNNRSGAGICWDSFNVGISRPSLINYVEDRDLWRHSLPHTDEIQCVTELQPYEFKDWYSYSTWLTTSFQEVVERGSGILQYKERIVQIMARRPRMIRFDGFDIPSANCIPAIKSELGNVLAQSQPFALLWHQASDGKFVYSLRSTDSGEDVSKIASRYGGGGHRNAAGFSSERLYS